MTNFMHNYVIKYVYFYNSLHVSSNSVPVIRWSNCINTSSVILFSVRDRSVCCFLNLHTERSLAENSIPDAVLMKFDFWMMGTELLETCRGL